MSEPAVVTSARPLPVRVLRVAGWITLALGITALGIGAILGFDELAKIWLAFGGLLFLTSLTAFLGARPTRGGLACAMVACTLLLLLPPVGTVLTFVIAIVASQTWPELRDYYRLRRRAA